MTVRIDGIDELIKRIKTIQQWKHVKASFRKGGVVLRGYLARYPAATSANSPANQRWYQRGYGSKWRTRSGAVHGRMTSQKLGQKWTVTQPGTGFRTIIGTNVSYAPFVQDEEKQASFHQVTGWPTVQSVETQHGQEVVEYVRKGIERELQG